MTKRRARSQPHKRRRASQSQSGFRSVWLVAAFVPILLLIFAAGVWLGDAPAGQSAAMPAAIPAALPTATANPLVAPGMPVKHIKSLDELPAGPVEHVQVTYFHRTQRCVACLEAEQLTRKTLNTYFADQLESGSVSLVIVDVQQSQNAALAKEFGAWTSSLFLGIVKDGVKYIWSINDFWFVLNSETQFMTSLRNHINVAFGGS